MTRLVTAVVTAALVACGVTSANVARGITLPAGAAHGPATSAASDRHPGAPHPLYGVTVDNVAHPGAIVAAEQNLPYRPTTRIYWICVPTRALAHAVAQVHGLVDAAAVIAVWEDALTAPGPTSGQWGSIRTC